MRSYNAIGYWLISFSMVLNAFGNGDQPTAGTPSYTTRQDTELIVGVADGLLHGKCAIYSDRVDADGNILVPQNLSVVISSFPDPSAGAIVSSTSDGAFIFRPAQGFAEGTAHFTYQIFDNQLLLEEGVVNIAVEPHSDPPAAPAPGAGGWCVHNQQQRPSDQRCDHQHVCLLVAVEWHAHAHTKVPTFVEQYS